MDLLISIKPIFVKEILLGSKKIEFRKNIFKNKEIDKIYVYSSMPEKKIVGYFKYQGYLSDSPIDLWAKTYKISGISKEFFLSYFKDREIAYGIHINEFIAFNDFINPYEIFDKFYPPQSYKYIQKDYFL